MAEKSNMMRMSGLYLENVDSTTGKSKGLRLDRDGFVARSKQAIMQNDARDTGSGKLLDVSSFSTFVFEVSGTFDGSIRVYGRRVEGQSTELIKDVFDIDKDNFIDDESGSIREEGLYKIDISDYCEVMTRVHRIDSGSVTINGATYMDKPNLEVVEETAYQVFDGDTEPQTYGGWRNVEMYSTASLTIDSEFDGEVILVGRVTGGGRVPLKIHDVIDRTSRYVDDGIITKPGDYLINISNYSEITVEVLEVKEGSLHGFLSFRKKKASIFDDVKIRSLYKGEGIVVKAGKGTSAGVEIPALSTNQCYFNYIHVRSDTVHNFGIDVAYRETADFPASMMERETILDGRMIRGTSEWFDVRGENLYVYITNHDDEDHTYNIIVGGVR